MSVGWILRCLLSGRRVRRNLRLWIPPRDQQKISKTWMILLMRKRLENHDHKVVTQPIRNHLPPLLIHQHHFFSWLAQTFFKFKPSILGKNKANIEEACIKLREKELEMQEARARRAEELKREKIELQRQQMELMAMSKREQDLIFYNSEINPSLTPR